MIESRLRSLIKGVTWRIVGTFDTILIAYLVTGNTIKSMSIGGIELITKVVLFYLHERAWIHISFGKKLSK